MAFGQNREFETLEQCMKAVEGQVPDPRAFCEELQRQSEQRPQGSQRSEPIGRGGERGPTAEDVSRAEQERPAHQQKPRPAPGQGQPTTSSF